MIKNIKSLLYPLGFVFLLVFLLIAINQLVSFYHNLSSIHPIVGVIGTSLLGLILLVLLITPFYLIAKLPAPLPFPDSDQSLENYKEKFKERLAKHPVSIENNLDPNNSEQLKIIDDKLKEKADQQR